MNIQDVIIRLKDIPESVFDRYLFENDYISCRIPKPDRECLAQKARQCGLDLSLQSGRTCQSDAYHQLKQQVEVRYFNDEGSDIYPMVFANFRLPNIISLNHICIDKTSSFCTEEGISDILDVPEITQILFIHELFHYIEHSTPDIFTQTERWEERGILGRTRKTSIPALSEIACSAFVQDMLSLDYSPEVFDVIFQWMMDPIRGKQLARRIFSQIGDQNTVDLLSADIDAVRTRRRKSTFSIRSGLVWKKESDNSHSRATPL